MQSIKPIDGSVVTDQGDFQADKLVLATGASPMLPTFSRELPGLVAAVTHAAVINKLRTRLASLQDLIIIGAGQSGCELANTLADAGKNVTVVEQHAGPLFELMPLDARRHLVEQLEERGVKFQFNARCASASKEGHRARLALTNGKTVEGDLVIACIGVVPNTKLASDAGLKVRKGIVVDRRMSTSAVNTYALGDCAEVNGVWPAVQPADSPSGGGAGAHAVRHPHPGELPTHAAGAEHPLLPNGDCPATPRPARPVGNADG